ncbi:(d)CMP kinase [Paenibacillus urinalis]|uniref:Cytidylate kinase n=1 Tax=Paenibacillus urinalis TaxID=521520 RepID=A0ABY7X549_9BACL|nr:MULTISPECIES: (d)CMP kinase [Paenibacillus]WDH97305.1 (d)CMP kinase [Paenibacillus urinalis]WDI00968.1 (d)CMP kinase [Paenibacillus urinalis]GAK39986.1 cytidylate kinase [Paenibacillus sp. TCA20]
MTSQKAAENGKLNVAIDGPAGAGKSTVARRVASELSYIYVDTGAMYRAVTYYMLRHEIEPEDVDSVLKHLRELSIELVPDANGQKVLLNGEDVSGPIRSREVTGIVSLYSQIEDLRTHLVELQRVMALRKGVVMDGRDIGTTVLPDAEVKIFMTASVKERALRRFNELEKTDDLTLEQLESDIAARDKLDQEREISPLRQADDAIVLDTTSMSIDEVVEHIVSRCYEVGREVDL